ncbi:MAG: hypothetical protein L6R00_08425 [Phycisphaerae bacterium]|nr:hypothetical protein [Phycisphaerae bacterium]
MSNAPDIQPVAAIAHRPAWLRPLGVITLEIAIVWGGVGWWLFKEVGTLIFMRQMAEFADAADPVPMPPAPQPTTDNRAAGSRTGGRRDIRQAITPRPREATATQPESPPPNALNVLTWSAPTSAAANQPADLGDAKMPAAPASSGVAQRTAAQTTAAQPQPTRSTVVPQHGASTAAPRAPPMRFIAEVAEPTRLIWAALTALLIGVIGASGVALVLPMPSQGFSRARRVVPWLLVAGGLFGLVLMLRSCWRPREVWTEAALIAGLRLTQSRYVWAAMLFLALLAMGLAASRAWRGRARIRTWMNVAVAAAFLGTFVTLAAISVLIHYAGFPPLPVWMYGVVALSQSALGWILLWSMLYLPHDEAPRGAPSRSAVAIP